MIEEKNLAGGRFGRAVWGQVNGLSVLEIGGIFLRESLFRITASAALEKQAFINYRAGIESKRQVPRQGRGISSPVICGAAFAKDKAAFLAASICFEQSYSGVDGDSAKLHRGLIALLSALSEFPLRQDIAVTGLAQSKRRHPGDWGREREIEGFFDVLPHPRLDRIARCPDPASNVED